MNKLQRALVKSALGAGALLGASAPVFAEAAIANDTLEGMPDVGEDIGDFLSNLAPGVGVFLLILGIFGGIVAIIYAVVKVIGRMVSRR